MFQTQVAPLTGSVDRNTLEPNKLEFIVQVAPLTGSVDRNLPSLPS